VKSVEAPDNALTLACSQLHRRIRQLEAELLQKNRANVELMQTCNQLLGPQKRAGAGKASISGRGSHALASRVAKLTTRTAALTDTLRATEEARCVEMSLLPLLAVWRALTLCVVR
jgi:hypothetical protein